jgi:high-affinity Fe2+/Pb2+ permease
MIRSNVISGAVCFAFGAFVFWLAQSVPPVTLTDNLGGRFFPQLISIMLMLASAGLILTGWMGIEISGGTVTQSGGDKGDRSVSPEDAGAAPSLGTPRFGASEVRLLSFIAAMLTYTLILPYIGYILASGAIFAVMIVIAGERRPVRVGLGAAVITVLLYVLFGVVFKMNLPIASLF